LRKSKKGVLGKGRREKVGRLMDCLGINREKEGGLDVFSGRKIKKRVKKRGKLTKTSPGYREKKRGACEVGTGEKR